MTDEGDGGGAPRKKGFPSWVWWGCGGGCLLLTLIGGALAVLVGGVVRDALDPEKAWSDVRALLAYDERPADWKAYGTTRLGRGVYTLKPPEDDVLVLLQTFSGRDELDLLLDPEVSEGFIFSMFDRLPEPVAGTIQLQGREARCLHFRGDFEEDRDDSAGSGILIDVSGQGTPTLLQIHFTHAEELLSPAQVAELLTPFDVWRGR